MAKPRKPTPISMARFFLSVGNYRQACRELWKSLWAWAAILFITGLLFSFGYGAMTEGKYILAVIFYVLGGAAVGARAIYDYRAHVLRKQISVIITLVTAVIVVGLISWTVYESKKPSVEQKLQEQTEQLNQQNQKLDETNKKLDETRRKLDEITRLLKEQNPNATPEKLKEKYSHGYGIAELNPTKAVVPYQNQLLEGFQVDWSVARVNDLGNGRVEVRMPDIYFNGSLMVHGNLVSLPKVPGAGMKLVQAHGAGVYAEVLAIAPDGGVVVVTGLRPE